MAVKSYALTTRTRLKDFLGITANDDTTNNVLDRIIDSVTEFIENYIGFRVKETTYTNEEYYTDNAESLLLKHYPISTSATFLLDRRTSALNEDNWERIDPQYYHVDHASGMINGSGGWRFFQTRRGYRVTYTAGFDYDNSTTFLSETQGGDIEWAAWQLGGTAWERRKGGGGIVSEKIGDYAVSYAKSVLENEEIKSILDKYAKQEAGGVLTPFHY